MESHKFDITYNGLALSGGSVRVFIDNNQQWEVRKYHERAVR